MSGKNAKGSGRFIILVLFLNLVGGNGEKQEYFQSAQLKTETGFECWTYRIWNRCTNHSIQHSVETYYQRVVRNQNYIESSVDI